MTAAIEGRRAASAGETAFAFDISPRGNVCLAEHVIYGQPVLPTDAFLEMIYVAARDHLGLSAVAIEDLVISSPVAVAPDATAALTLIFRPDAAGVGWLVAVTGAGHGNADDATNAGKERQHLHLKARLRPQTSLRPERERPDYLDRWTDRLSADDIYARHPALAIGPFYRTIAELRIHGDVASAKLSASDQARDASEQFLLAPAMVNGMLMTALSFAIRLSGDPARVYVPIGAGAIDLWGDIALDAGLAVARLRASDGDTMSFDVELSGPDGACALTARDLKVQRLGAEHLMPTHGSVRVDAPAVAPADERAVAIVGAAGRFPGAPDLAALWRNLAGGVDSVCEIPIERWDSCVTYSPDPRAPGRSLSRWGGFIDGVEMFDPAFFGLSPMEAEIMDPQQRLFLQEGFRALEDAGCRTADLRGRRCAIFVGGSTGDYEDLLARAGKETSAQAFTGLSPAVLAARIAYFLDFDGPAVAVDTACSSSLVALSMACRSLLDGESDLALVGGVQLMMTPKLHIKASKAGMLSPSGRCRPFDRDADGIALGEGVVAVVCKRVADALRDGDRIHGVVGGFGMNQDGRTNGITAPNPAAQRRLEGDVYRRFGIAARRIGYVETHGTGTPLGDPVEVGALIAAFRQQTADRHFCAIGSVKANIGHTAFAAGLAGVVKILAALKHGQIPPSINYREPNPRLELDDSPFFVTTELSPWPRHDGKPRLAAVSSFGFSGTNCHVVLEEGPALSARTVLAERPAYLVPVTAKSERSLVAYLAALRAWVSAHDVFLGDLSYTLLVRRDHFARRRVFVVRDRDELVRAIDAESARAGGGGGNGPDERDRLVSETPAPVEDAQAVLAALAQTTSDESEYRRELGRVARLFLAGRPFDWAALTPPADHRLLTLPGYQFEEVRCSIEAPRQVQQPALIARSEELERLPEAQPSRADGASHTTGVVRYLRSDWTARPLTHGAAANADVVALFTDDDGAYEAVACALRGSCGAKVLRLGAGDGAQEPRPNHVIFIWRKLPPSDAGAADLAAAVAREAFFSVSAAIPGVPGQGGAVSTRVLVFHPDEDEVSVPALAGLEALLRSAAAERPSLSWRSISLPAVGIERLAKIVCDEIEAVDQTGAFQYDRDLVRSARTLREIPAPGPDRREGAFRRGATYLLTGGLGALGLVLAKHIVAAYAARLVLLGRSEPTGERRASLQALERLGASCLFVKADVTRRADLEVALGEATAAFGPIHGVVHMAGALRDFRERASRAAMEQVLRPKIDGVVSLDQLTADQPLELFLLFSSISSVLGNAGQADYAYANGFMDGFARYRERLRALGRRAGRTVSISWPLWREGRLRGEALEKLVERTMGMRAMDSACGIEALERCLDIGRPHVIVAFGDAGAVSRLPVAVEPIAAPSLGGAESRAGAEDVATFGSTTTSTSAASASATASLESVEDALADDVAAVLKLDRATVHADDDLMDYGFDSIILTDLANRLNDRFGLDMTPASLFSHSTIRDLACHLLATSPAAFTASSASPAPPPPSPPSPPRPRVPATAISADAANEQPNADGIAIVGIAADLPGADDLNELWDHLENGRVLTGEVPSERWDPGVAEVRWGGFLREVQGFDAAFFGISPREAELMDPQQRLFLEVVWRAIEDAGYRPSALSGSSTGLFVGVATSDYAALLKERGHDGQALAATGLSHALLANRISYQLNLRGPSEPCNTACSSSLVAIHRACEALRAGRCEMAIAGGVNLLLTPALFQAFDAAGMLSPDGRLRAFDRDANGYVRGEGVGALVLKPLGRALADRDHIYGVVRASEVNHGGRAHSLTAPNPNAQADLLIAAYRRAQIAPDRISLIEAHGSGTVLGDPIEIEGLTKALRVLHADWNLPFRTGAGCAVGTIKGNVGHLEAAAGVAGVIKVLLALAHRKIPANATLVEVNPQVRLDGTPLYLARRLEEWGAVRGADGRALRVAGVSSFGFGGANAHVVIEEHADARLAERAEHPEHGGAHAVLLSARTADRLSVYARRLAADVGSGRIRPGELADLAFTSQVGREPLRERLALVVEDLAELREKLRAFADRNESAADVFRGRADASAGAGRRAPDEERYRMASIAAAGDLRALCRSWVDGADVPWQDASRDPDRRRISFATYPFDRKRHWCDGVVDRGAAEHASPERPGAKLKLRSVQAAALAEPAEPPPEGDLAPAELPPRVTPLVAMTPGDEPSGGRLRGEVRRLLAATLHLPESEIERDQTFAELGLDSILALELAKSIQRDLRIRIKAIELFDHPTVERLAAHLEARAGELVAVVPIPDPPARPAAPAAEPPPPPDAEAVVAAADPDDRAASVPRGPVTGTPADTARCSSSDEPALALDIAVIGMAGRFPGAANTAQLWANLAAGVSSITEVPPARWGGLGPHGKAPRWGGFLADADKFDPLFFNISPGEAELMDPQQRLMLEESWTALEDAGYTRERLDGARCGVYVGVMNNDYYELLARDPKLAGQALAMTGNATSIVAARVAYVLNLRGPTMQIDTACSSSLVATHLAVRSLLTGEADLMLAGGVTLYLAETSYAKMEDAGMLSRTGRCYTFDERADGFVPGEAAAVVVLKRCGDALRDGDRIYGIIKASGINQDGRTNGITAPSAASQRALELDVYRRHAIDVETLSYIEAHGTGTSLGDPIEVTALTEAFRELTSRRQFCGIGSLKTNIGHTSAAAGVASLIKVLLALRHRQLPPSLNCATPNPLIDFEASPFRVVTELTEWTSPADVPRRAAVSAFGFSGTNAHLLVEEHLGGQEDAADAVSGAATARPQVIVLSARDPERLRAHARNLADHLAAYGDRLALADLAYTLQAGRTEWEERLAFVASSIREVEERLRRAATADDSAAVVGTGWFVGSLGRGARAEDWMFEGSAGQRYVDMLVTSSDLERLARVWTRGVPIDWRPLRDARAPRAPRLLWLPPYPFARGRHWFRSEAQSSRGGDAGDLASLLEIDGARSFEEGGLVFRLAVSEEDPLLRDHRVKGRPVLPGSAFIVLATAVCHRVGHQTTGVRIENLMFVEPLEVRGQAVVEIALAPAGSSAGGGRRFAIQTRRADGSAAARVHAQGNLVFEDGAAAPPDVVDLVDLQRRCATVVEVEGLYARAALQGIAYGPAFRRLRRAWRDGDDVLAELDLAAHAGTSVGGAAAAPIAIDAAMQAISVLMPGAPAGGALVPAGIATASIVGDLPLRGFSYVRRRDSDDLTFDVRVVDEQGRLCAALNGVRLAPLRSRALDLLYVPAWQDAVAPAEPSVSAAEPRAIAVVLDRNDPESRALAGALAAEHQRRGDRVHEACWREPGVASEAAHDADTVYFLCGDRLPATPADEVRAFFGLVKSLDARGAADRPLALTAVTQRAHRVLADDVPRPDGAAVSGFCRSLARERHRWTVRCIDVGPDGCARRTPAALIVDEPAGAARADVAFRGLRRYLQRIEPLGLPARADQDPPPFRLGGRYLIVGGLGGIGFELAQHLAQSWAARLVLVGRRPPDAETRAHIERITAAGGQAVYVQADVASAADIRRAYDRARAAFGGLDGVVHSAIVLRDATVATMSPEALDAVLSPKALGTRVLFEVFEGTPLDFMLFFSSAESFSGDAGQSNYAAASRFEDGAAAAARAGASFPVIVINWGYWGSVGVVATDRYRDALAAQGVGSIEPSEGIEIVESVLVHRARLSEVVVLKGEVAALPTIDVAADSRRELLASDGRRVPLAPLPEVAFDPAAFQRSADGFARLDRLAGLLLSTYFADRGLFRRAGQLLTPGEVAEICALDGRYRRLLPALVQILRRGGHVTVDPAGHVVVAAGVADLHARDGGAAAAAVVARALVEDFPELAAHVRLLNTCVQSYADVLCGRREATDVMFPGGSTALVQSVYDDPGVADYFGRRSGAIIRDQVQRRLAERPDRPVTILEVGAGTGATSRFVLAALDGLPGPIHYVYSDVSPFFVDDAGPRVAAARPWVERRLFDVEAPPELQGIEAGAVDIAFAANVLHATRDLVRSLDHLKRVLAAGGVLLLSEATAAQSFATMTFGLLDGWWRFEDPWRRLDGAPLVDAPGWCEVLREAGLEEITAVGAPGIGPGGAESHALIVGVSDGMTRVRAELTSGRERAHSIVTPRAVAVGPSDPVPAASTAGGAAGDRSPAGALAYVKSVFAEVLRIPFEKLDPDVTLERFGVDSLVNLKLVRRMEDDLGPQPSTLLFEHATIRRLADHLAARHGREMEARRAISAEQAPPARASNGHGALTVARPAAPGEIAPGAADRARGPHPEVRALEPTDAVVAVIGCSGRYPLADDLDAFFDNLQAGRSCVREIPPDRWDPSRTDGEIYSRHGAFLADVDKFDDMFFNIVPADAAALDPQARVFLEVAAEAMENAGCTSRRLDRLERSVGVFVGVMNSDYELRSGEAYGQGCFTPAHSAHWIIANRVSYHFDLHGPSYAVDSACSSSLTATHLAIESLRRGECKLAVAGGVNLILHPLHYHRLCRMKMLAADHRCKPFGAGADGFVDGEGAGALVLKLLRDAIDDGDHIHAVIKASAVNAGGKTSGFTVPNPNAQVAVIERALASAGIDPSTISYVEAHGTGTALGDPIEVAALSRIFRDRAAGLPPVALGSVKANIGHLESAAGIAGLTKVILQLRERTLLPSIHARAPNERIAFDRSPFRVQQEPAPWLPSSPAGTAICRRAAVSSFGAGGANAHVIVEEYPANDERRAPPPPHEVVFALSARRPERLVAYADRMLAFLRRRGPDVPLADVAYTLQVAREEERYRLAMLVRSVDELLEKLSRFVRQGGQSTGPRSLEDVFEGVASGDGDGGEAAGEGRAPLRLGAGGLGELARRWVQGTPVDWEAIYAVRPRRISLPPHPFLRRPCEIDVQPIRPSPVVAEGADRRSATERLVRSAAAKILKVPDAEVDMSADISEYGLDSINVMFMVAKIQELLDMRLDPKEVMEHRTLTDLAAYLARTSSSDGGASAATVAPPGHDDRGTGAAAAAAGESRDGGA